MNTTKRWLISAEKQSIFTSNFLFESGIHAYKSVYLKVNCFTYHKFPVEATYINKCNNPIKCVKINLYNITNMHIYINIQIL